MSIQLLHSYEASLVMSIQLLHSYEASLVMSIQLLLIIQWNLAVYGNDCMLYIAWGDLVSWVDLIVTVLDFTDDWQ